MQQATNNKDYYYTEMIGMMREQGRKDNPTTLQLGVMQSSNSVKIGDLVLNAEDLYFAESLLAGYTLPLDTPYVDSVTFGSESGTYTTKDAVVKASGLQKGDIVAVQKLSDTNRYVILSKVVQAK